MRFILLLHTIIEGATAFFFLFYPSITDMIPGMGDAEGNGVQMLVSMYAVAALTLAILSLITYFSLREKVLVLTVAGVLAIFHLGIMITQLIYSPDARAAALHLILAVVFIYAYAQWRKQVVEGT